MDLREMSTDRLVTVSVRLLAVASVLTTAGIGFSTWASWRQIGQSFGAEGMPIANDVGFQERVSITIFQSSFGTGGLQLSLAAMLLACAVVALHLHPTRSRVRSLRWEVFAAGVVILVPTVVLVLGNLYLLTDPSDDDADEAVVGSPPIIDIVGNGLAIALGALLVLVLAALWWVRLGTTPDVGAAADDEADEEGEDVDDHADDGDGSEHVHRTPGSPAVADRSPDRPAHGTFGEPTRDYSRDWSPEDFRPPR